MEKQIKIRTSRIIRKDTSLVEMKYEYTHNVTHVASDEVDFQSKKYLKIGNFPSKSRDMAANG